MCVCMSCENCGASIDGGGRLCSDCAATEEEIAPLGIKVICGLGALGVLLVLFRNILILSAGGAGGAAFISVLFIVLSFGLAVVIYGLWTLQSWAWSWALVFFGIDLLTNLLGVLSGDVTAIAGAIVSLIILGYIYSKRDLYAWQ